MSEPEKKRIQVLMNSYVNLINAGEIELVKEIEKKLLNEIKFVKRKDWFNHAFCGDFPVVDKRCIVFCCPVSKMCPYRFLVLKKMGLDERGYKEFKLKMGEFVK